MKRKTKILFALILLICMGTIPIITAKNYNNDYIKTDNKTSALDFSENKTNTNSSENDVETKVLNLVLCYYKENFSDETIKAMAILFATDYKANGLKTNNSDAIIDKEFFNENPDVYKRIKEIVDANIEKIIYINGKTEYIPFSPISNGTTFASEDYDYLSPVASPWDCYNDDYSNDMECVGVSLSGINYLCKNNCNAETALKWYLPNCEVK